MFSKKISKPFGGHIEAFKLPVSGGKFVFLAWRILSSTLCRFEHHRKAALDAAVAQLPALGGIASLRLKWDETEQVVNIDPPNAAEIQEALAFAPIRLRSSARNCHVMTIGAWFRVGDAIQQ